LNSNRNRGIDLSEIAAIIFDTEGETYPYCTKIYVQVNYTPRPHPVLRFISEQHSGWFRDQAR
jgi:hypothetical protein